MSRPVHIQVVVDGEPHPFEFPLERIARSVVAEVVAKLQLARPPKDYELRWFNTGEMLDLDQSLADNGVAENAVLALNPQAGYAG